MFLNQIIKVIGERNYIKNSRYFFILTPSYNRPMILSYYDTFNSFLFINKDQRPKKPVCYIFFKNTDLYVTVYVSNLKYNEHVSTGIGIIYRTTRDN